jgi:hypothetical protein
MLHCQCTCWACTTTVQLCKPWCKVRNRPSCQVVPCSKVHMRCIGDTSLAPREAWQAAVVWLLGVLTTAACMQRPVVRPHTGQCQCHAHPSSKNNQCGKTDLCCINSSTHTSGLASSLTSQVEILAAAPACSWQPNQIIKHCAIRLRAGRCTFRRLRQKQGVPAAVRCRSLSLLTQHNQPRLFLRQAVPLKIKRCCCCSAALQLLHQHMPLPHHLMQTYSTLLLCCTLTAAAGGSLLPVSPAAAASAHAPAPPPDADLLNLAIVLHIDCCCWWLTAAR